MVIFMIYLTEFVGANCVRPLSLQHAPTGEHSSPLQNKRKIPCF